MTAPASAPAYRGRLAPSPTGYLHLGHARTFWIAQQRAAGGTLILRNEDLDPDRCKPEFYRALLEDMHWFGLRWQEGPDCGGPRAPYSQSARRALHVEAFQTLLNRGWIYPCHCSRRDVQQALGAPHAGDEEPVYPGTCRPSSGLLVPGTGLRVPGSGLKTGIPHLEPGTRIADLGRNWRFRVPDGETIAFQDHAQGQQSWIAGKDFGDFVVWRHDDSPSYQLAVTVDDAAMGITEVVRGCDLLVSTARQLLLYRALGLTPPDFFHGPLLVDAHGVRLAKRHDALSLRAFRERGVTPEELRASPGFGLGRLTQG